MLEETTVGTNLSRKAMLLMAEVLHLANRLLPLEIAAKVQVCDVEFYMSYFLIDPFTQGYPTAV
jgi:rapamycin-insensitive companion of mTOR